MTVTLVFEQLLNGLQFGLMLFLIAAGLTLVFGIMDVLNLAHGSLYMIGAYLAALLTQATGSFWLGLPLAVLATGAVGIVLELLLVRRLYQRDHLAQVLATFAVILIANDGVKMIWGPAPIMLGAPAALAGPVELLPGFFYPAYRLLIIGVGLALALGLYLLVARTRTGMLVRAGSSNREMAAVMGVRVDRLFALVFVLGAMLAAVAGALLGLFQGGCSSGGPKEVPLLKQRDAVGRLAENTYETPTGQLLTPAGRQVALPGMRPQALALSPDTVAPPSHRRSFQIQFAETLNEKS